ncbi:Hypothetical protein MBVG_4820 [Mycoplasmopsis bovigenitalium 51080]|uniref:Uncharacterized protein n=1 Tax=Mycoplasmopsis bovigenitalium 51080 TaxID=1188235 RepID=N9VCR0_9BACT|nr:hypothetical protein [Mycoplasmopsis bovigenitalium]ENY69176.1 Hypothetical protein MBVG_4820 [Mycoplasmopsis bovigenitalium 51080]
MSNNKTNWKLGDTAWRVNNQLALYTFAMKFIANYDSGEISENSEISEFEDFWEKCVKEGYKRNKQPGKHIKKDINLLLKTLKWLGLIEHNSTKSFKGILTDDGYFFNQLIDSNKYEKIEKILREKFQTTIYEFFWLTIILRFNLSNTEVKSDIQPFLELIKAILNNGAMDINGWKEWNLINSGIKPDRIQNQLSSFRKPPKNIQILNQFVDLFKNSDYEGVKGFLLAFSSIVSKGMVVSKIILKYLSREIKEFDKKKITTYVEELSYLIKTTNTDKFLSSIDSIRKSITAEDEYSSINLYWLQSLNIFKIDKNSETSFIKLKNENIVNLLEKLLEGDFFSQKTSLKQATENIFKLIESFSTNVDALNENIPIPFTLEEVNLILRSDCNINLVLKGRNEIKNLDNIKSLVGIPMYLLYEYLINLHVWLSIQHKESSIHADSFINICKTKLNSKLMPICQAPGGGSDGFIETSSKNILIETTTLKHFSALIKNEVEPIKRHAFSAWEKNSKETIVLFFTKYLHKSLLQYLYFAFDNLKEFSKTQKKWISTNNLIFLNPILIKSHINGFNFLESYNLDKNWINKKNEKMKKNIINDVFFDSNMFDNLEKIDEYY